MSNMKTQPSAADVDAFLAAIPDEARRDDCRRVRDLMQQVTGEEPRMWGSSMVGFGTYHYRYESGREGDWFITGFAPRKNDLTLYIMAGFARYDELMQRLGKHRTGKSCLYVKRLDDVNMDVLEELVRASVQYMREAYS